MWLQNSEIRSSVPSPVQEPELYGPPYTCRHVAVISDLLARHGSFMNPWIVSTSIAAIYTKARHSWDHVRCAGQGRCMAGFGVLKLHGYQYGLEQEKLLGSDGRHL